MKRDAARSVACWVAWRLCAALILLGGCVTAWAQNLDGLTGTIRITADSLLRSGELAGCTINYQAAVQDHTYKKGALIAVSGSFSLNLIGKGNSQTVAPLLKVGLKQVFPVVAGGPEAPAFAYLQSARGSTARSVLADDVSDTPGFRIFVLSFDENTMAVVRALMDGDPLSLYYSSSKGGLDVQVPLDMRVIESKATGRGIEAIRGETTLTTFRDCFMKLADSLTK
jgi:hypothetical protein